jgi:transcriptional regulator with XRE-family HTH domain
MGRSTVADTEIIRKVLSANLKKYRAQEGISQEKLAERTELSDQLIRDIESCRSWVSDKTMVKLARALKVEAYQLLFPQGEADKIFPVRLPADVLRDLQDNIKTSIDWFFDAVVKEE